MVSTSLSYNLIVRDMKKALDHVSKQPEVARDAAYYQDNIGKVKTADEFLKNDRLYRYAMKAFGLEDMAYAKAFIGKVLRSNLSDPESFANKLTDTRYREFAAAFSFTGSNVKVVQTATQTDETIGLYTKTIQQQADGIKEETRYYNVMMDKVKKADDILNNDRLRAYMFAVFDIDEHNWSRDTVRKLMSSDPNDPGSYINTVWSARRDDIRTRLGQSQTDLQTVRVTLADLTAELKAPGADRVKVQGMIDQQNVLLKSIASKIASYNNSIAAIGKYYDLAAAYQFSANGTLAPGVMAQTDAEKKKANETYVFKNPRVTPSAALLNKQYFEQKVASARSIDELFASPLDDRIYKFLDTAFGIGALVPATLENILTSDRDPNNLKSYVNMAGAKKQQYRNLMNAFNFNRDGTLNPGVAAQTAAQTKLTTNFYMGAYNDADDAADEAAINQFKRNLPTVKDLDTFMRTANVYNFALKAVGLDPAAENTLTIRNVLTSDLQNPKSYVYRLKDERYLKLAREFNFDAKGKPSEPLVAQSDITITQTAKQYIVEKLKFASNADKGATRTKAEKEAKYYQDTIGKIKTVDQLLGDRKLLNVVMTAKGIDPTRVTDAYLKKIFKSDLKDPKSFANSERDLRFSELAASFNFDARGNLAHAAISGVQGLGQLLETQHNYLQQALESQQGEDNPGVRLALYFERKAGDIRSAYDILADGALSKVFRTAFRLPDEVANMKIEQQAKVVDKYLNLKDLSDPQKLKSFINRFNAMYDMQNDQADSNAALATLSRGGGAGGISSSTLMALSQLGRR